MLVQIISKVIRRIRQRYLVELSKFAANVWKRAIFIGKDMSIKNFVRPLKRMPNDRKSPMPRI